MTNNPVAGAPQPDHFILASQSPRRRQFLAALPVPFTVMVPTNSHNGPGVDETPRPGETPAALVQRLSLAKASALTAQLPQRWPAYPHLGHVLVIAADTEVALGNEVLGKPATPAEAAAMLRRLRAQPHHVYSGLTVINPTAPADVVARVTRLHQSTVWMRPYTDAEIEAYVAGGSPLDKAGAYGIQDEGFAPVAKLEGCFASVMGFPLGELATALAHLGFALPAVAPACRRQTGHPCCQQPPEESL